MPKQTLRDNGDGTILVELEDGTLAVIKKE